MNRANPAQLRTALEVANGMAQAGILFVSIPVTSDDERAQLLLLAAEKLEAIASETEQGESEE